ncbi:MAG: MoaD/ThiS family protein [Treponema sp.]|nr:MoaD/ThiS family protein [Treponema sp.]
MKEPASGAKVTIKYRADLLNKIKKENESISASTIKDALTHINKQYGKDAYKLAKKLLIVVNGQSIHMLRHFKTVLKEGDEVSFLPICGGG